MTPPKKPDWIELADSDGGSNNLAPVAKKSRPLVVAMAALTLTFGGAVIAQTYQGGSGDSAQPSLDQASQSAAIATSVNQVRSVQSPSIKAPSIGKSAVPAIAIPPSMNGGDDGYDDDEDEDEYEEGDHDDEDRGDH
jgi:hypothetical protein